MNVPAEIPAGVCRLHLSREFSAPGWRSCWEQGGRLFLSFSFSERLEGKLSMWSKRAGAGGGASKTLWGRKTKTVSSRCTSVRTGLAAKDAYAGLHVVIGDGHGEEVRGRQAQFCSQQPDQAWI